MPKTRGYLGLLLALTLVMGCTSPGLPGITSTPISPTQAMASTSTASPAAQTMSPATSKAASTATVLATLKPTGTAAAEPTPEPTFAEPTPTPEPTTTPLAHLAYGAPVSLVDTWMFADDTGWGLDADGRILRTRDGGSGWEDVTPPSGAYRQGGFFTLDPSTAWAIPYYMGCSTEACLPVPRLVTVWHTTNGGKDWQALPPLCLGADCGYDYEVPTEALYPVSMQFVDQNNGWILMVVLHLMFQDHYRLYHTTDGGQRWEMVSDSMSGPGAFSVTGVAFLDAQTGWMANSEVGGASDPRPNWSIYQTKDAGRTWEETGLPQPIPAEELARRNIAGCGAEQISSRPPLQLDVTIGCSTAEHVTTAVYFFSYHSSDGGQTWTSFETTGSAFFVDASTGWRLFADETGRGSQLMQTKDGGATWNKLKGVIWEKAQFSFVNEQAGWVIVRIGEERAFLKTQDGGATWKMLHPQVTAAAAEAAAAAR